MATRTSRVNRREFVKSGFAATVVAPTMIVPSGVKPVVISDVSGIRFNNGGPMSSVEKAFDLMTKGERVIDAVVAGVQIPENDPEESGIGFGGLPNADGVVQLDACCMDGPTKRAGGVAAIEGVRTPSIVAQAVMESTDHHLLVGAGAQSFARNMGIPIEDDLNTENSRRLWLEWKRRIDPTHYLDPATRAEEGYRAGLTMVVGRSDLGGSLLGDDELQRDQRDRRDCRRDHDERPFVQDSRPYWRLADSRCGALRRRRRRCRGLDGPR